MNEAVFKISINEAGKILKKMDFLKSKKDINIGNILNNLKNIHLNIL